MRPTGLPSAAARAAPLYTMGSVDERERAAVAGSAAADCALLANAAEGSLLASLRCLVRRTGCSTTVAHGPWNVL